jgi:hypothetical protein
VRRFEEEWCRENKAGDDRESAKAVAFEHDISPLLSAHD